MVFSEFTCNDRYEVMHRGIGLEVAQCRDLDRMWGANARQIIAEKIDESSCSRRGPSRTRVGVQQGVGLRSDQGNAQSCP